MIPLDLETSELKVASYLLFTTPPPHCILVYNGETKIGKLIYTPIQKGGEWEIPSSHWCSVILKC